MARTLVFDRKPTQARRAVLLPRGTTANPSRSLSFTRPLHRMLNCQQRDRVDRVQDIE
ncbi:hypothetical protein [Zarconia navalis]|uniref:hypothetical protein n=1 Tax=Zarconia navalis TaxID=2992134 RepID=UPI0021F86FEE|nr:hypothetical protein [Zarconia navalis]